MGEFFLPTRIVTGNGCFSRLGSLAAGYGQVALLACGASSLRASGGLDRALDSLNAAGVDVDVYDAVSSEPTLEIVQRGIERARARGVQVVLGIGGGSAMDAAKAIAGLAPLPGTVYEYWRKERTIADGGLPWIAVPTVAGTGAEVTKNAVLISPQDRVKSSLRHDDWFANIALLDPEMTLSVPADVTAASGLDALTQAIESYTSIGAMPVTDALATDAILRISRSLERAYHNGSDIEARADLLYGSMLAGCALANARLGAVHGMAHPLGARYGISHGVVCGLLLPYTMAYNLEYALLKYAHVARLLGVDTSGLSDHRAAEQAVARVRDLVQAVGVPTRLAPLGVRPDDLDRIAQQSLTSSSLQHNPRRLDHDDVVVILRDAM